MEPIGPPTGHPLSWRDPPTPRQVLYHSTPDTAPHPKACLSEKYVTPGVPRAHGSGGSPERLGAQWLTRPFPGPPSGLLCRSWRRLTPPRTRKHSPGSPPRTGSRHPPTRNTGPP
ncbi:hypothetical protein T261_2891 [Streptomyces lydicus]|nr:hypothetical protein T261_2891 [Streptomyces lydicus]